MEINLESTAVDSSWTAGNGNVVGKCTLTGRKERRKLHSPMVENEVIATLTGCIIFTPSLICPLFQIILWSFSTVITLGFRIGRGWEFEVVFIIQLALICDYKPNSFLFLIERSLLDGISMSSSSTQLYASRMGIYEPFHQINSWPTNAFGSRLDTSISPINKVDDCVDNKPEFVPFESMDHLESSEEMNKPIDDKVQRRLAQNREAARKSRMRKKVYVQQLETSRMKLAQLEEELERTRQQKGTGCLVDTSHFGFSGLVNPGIAAFEMEYNHWVEEQQRQINELRKALQVHTTDIELQILVESSLNHYHNLFCMKAKVAKADVFYLMSGVWRSSAERFFLWIGGFRPSELLNNRDQVSEAILWKSIYQNVLKPYFEPLNEQQRADIHKLQQSSRQAEDALTQGMEKLHQNLSLSIAGDPVGSYISQMGDGMEKLEALENFISQKYVICDEAESISSKLFTSCRVSNLKQKVSFLRTLCVGKNKLLKMQLAYASEMICADHLRQQTLKRMSHLLTTRQAAQGLLALGEYFHRLRVLSSLWATRPREPA
uniref:Transcription factor TGA7-like n=1 Tax=Cucumis melo TaxID=3656 RepID=A0A9I9CTQ0_CUCME